jgi:hypothetical protein
MSSRESKDRRDRQDRSPLKPSAGVDKGQLSMSRKDTLVASARRGQIGAQAESSTQPNPSSQHAPPSRQSPPAELLLLAETASEVSRAAQVRSSGRVANAESSREAGQQGAMGKSLRTYTAAELSFGREAGVQSSKRPAPPSTTEERLDLLRQEREWAQRQQNSTLRSRQRYRSGIEAFNWLWEDQHYRNLVQYLEQQEDSILTGSRTAKLQVDYSVSILFNRLVVPIQEKFERENPDGKTRRELIAEARDRFVTNHDEVKRRVVWLFNNQHFYNNPPRSV